MTATTVRFAIPRCSGPTSENASTAAIGKNAGGEAAERPKIRGPDAGPERHGVAGDHGGHEREEEREGGGERSGRDPHPTDA
jgi:hypothetical protein